MVEINPSESVGASGPQKSTDKSNPMQFPHQNFKPGSVNSFKNWLGPKGFAQFQKTMCSTISRQIGKEQAKAKKAARRLKLAEEGKDMNDA